YIFGTREIATVLKLDFHNCRVGCLAESPWHQLPRRPQPQDKLAAWWYERVDPELQRRQILIRWQPPTVVSTEFSQLPPITGALPSVNTSFYFVIRIGM